MLLCVMHHLPSIPTASNPIVEPCGGEGPEKGVVQQPILYPW